jgi:hypothetical protein
VADLFVLPGNLNITIWRGDVRPIKVNVYEKNPDGTRGDPKVLPTSGWSSQIKAEWDEDGTGEVLGTFEVDASEGADGILYLIPDGVLTATLAEETVYDVQHEDGPITEIEGKLKLKGQGTT